MQIEMKLKSDFEIDFDGLRNFLKELKYQDYQDGVKIKKGTSIDDINRFYNKETSERKLSIPLGQIIAYGMPFLVDAIGNDISVCILTKRNYKLPTGRVVKMKFVTTIIHNCSDQHGSCLNGYWMIPPQFINFN